jgi:hypothetical protein
LAISLTETDKELRANLEKFSSQCYASMQVGLKFYQPNEFQENLLDVGLMGPSPTYRAEAA